MDAVAELLERLGLAQYRDAFSRADIDRAVLRDLTEADLEKLGVTLGHRKKLLRAIAELAAAGVERPTDRPTVALSPKAADAERRQVTVMFCDLVGSTALSGRLDPEDLREVIGAYHRCVADTVARFDGFVAKYMGDGVLVYFGYPQAHEDDAERAVRAGLALVDAVGALEAAERLRLRIGIATGLVVVGDLLGAGSAREQAIVGDTPNLAARLQGLAEPDAIVIAAATRRLLGNLFKLRDLGRHEVKGFAAPVPAWAIEGRLGCREPLRVGACRPSDGLRRPRARNRPADGALEFGAGW